MVERLTYVGGNVERASEWSDIKKLHIECIELTESIYNT